ncbi:hypothetical protein [Streptomyces sp. NPDC051561]|uniref:hypothetical protein n=1 Tax=Streptomyces sp. NPDC051561 TaxID=3365658 RepID=UPI0037B3D972
MSRADGGTCAGWPAHEQEEDRYGRRGEGEEDGQRARDALAWRRPPRAALGGLCVPAQAGLEPSAVVRREVLCGDAGVARRARLGLRLAAGVASARLRPV